MSRPTTRVLALLELLQARGQASGAQLAAALDVDRRTLRRYVTRLEELGVPITTEQGRHGGYRLVPGYKLPPMMFTDEEALALALGLLAARGLGLADAAPAIASAQAKLERVLPAPLRQRARAVDESMALALPRGSRQGESETLAALGAAAHARRRVQIHYRAPDGTKSARGFDPYGLVWRGGHWYAIGYCHLRQGLRSFRVDRIGRLQSLPESFARPVDFDALAYLSHALATMTRRHGIEVVLHTDLATARREVFDTIGLLQPVDDGVRLSAQADDLDWVARELARLPFAFTVQAPVALRDAVRALAKRLQTLVRPKRGDARSGSRA